MAAARSLFEAWKGVEIGRRWLYSAIAFHIVCALVLMPVASHPYDLAVLTGNAEAWFRWGFPPLYNWKFGVDYAALPIAAQSLRAFLAGLGLPGVVALHIAWKLPLVAANLVTAGAIYRIVAKLKPDQAAAFAALWLVNPVALWVSAGHGQVEALALMCVFVALQLAIEGRLMWSGLVVGLGVGIEYFPIAVAATVVLWWRSGQVSGAQVVRFGIGLALSVGLCFAPLLVDPTTRSGLIAGLASSGGVGTIVARSHVSAWAWLDPTLAPLWPFVFVAAAMLAFAVAWRFAGKNHSAGIVYLSVVLVTAIVADPNALAQFSLIAAAALWLLALVVAVPPLLMILVPTAGLATVFVFPDSASTANAYFYDDWAGTAANLLPVGKSDAIATFLGHVFSLGLIATMGFAAMRRRSWSRAVGRVAALGVGAAMCAALAVWSAQPAIWQAAFAGSPTASVPDFDLFIANRGGAVESVGAGPGLYHVVFSDSLIAAARESRVQPSASLAIFAPDLFQREEADQAGTVQTWADRSVAIPRWTALGPSVRSVWIEVLLGSPQWTAAAPPATATLSAAVNGATIPASQARVVIKGWALVDFEVPASLIDATGTLDVLPAPSSLLWNGSPTGPWIRLLPASGVDRVFADGKRVDVSYRVGTDGTGYLAGLPLLPDYLVSLDRTEPGIYTVQGAVLRWPETPPIWQKDLLTQAIGAAFGLLLLLATAWLVRLYLASTSREARGRRSVPLVGMFCRYGIDRPGGVEAVVAALSQRLGTDSGWQVEVVAAFGKATGVARVPVAGDAIAALRFAWALLNRSFDLAVVHGAEYAWAPILAARIRHVPVVVVWHGLRTREAIAPGGHVLSLGIWMFRRIAGGLERAAARAPFHVSVSPHVTSQIVRLYAPWSMPVTIPNGIEVAAAPPAAVARPARFNALWVGTAPYKKGLDVAIAACEMARAQLPLLRLTVVGPSRDEKAAWSKAASDAWIDWTGPIAPDEMRGVYRGADLLVFPTRSEACPMVVLEAMSEGVPVLGSPEVRWMLEGAGIVAPGWDPADYAAEIVRVLSSGDDLLRLHVVALDRARQYSWSSACDKYRELLRDALNNRTGTSQVGARVAT